MTKQTESILKQACLGIMEVDSNCSVLFANPRAEELLGCEISIGSSLKTIAKGLGELVIACMGQERQDLARYIREPATGLEVLVSIRVNENGTKQATCFMRGYAEAEASAWELPNIKEMRLQFQTLIDHSYYGIYILDHKGVVLKVNDVAPGLIGLKKEEMLGMNIKDLVKNGIVDQALTPSILESKKSLTRPLFVTKSNKYIMASGMPIFDEDGNIIFVVVIEHDMTIVKELRAQLEHAKQVTETVKNELSERNLLELKNSEIIADSPAMSQVLTVLLKLAKLDASKILITGESGTGKGFLSKFVHHNGIRKNQPFISINCAALPDMLLEAELFGYEKGAFTGASDSGKAGLFELANQGTIFLDEIGDLPFPLQAKLLKCLDDGEIRRLGGTRAIKVDCIVIAATNQNLEELVQEKKFRQDLYFRLNIFPVHIPPLRERQEDILKISNFYLNQYNQKYNQKKRFSEKCIETFQSYNFPGNVRELKNLIKNAVVIREKNVLGKIVPNKKVQLKDINTPTDKKASATTSLNDALMNFERKKLEQALEKFDSTRDIADYLDTSQSTIVRKLKRHGLSID